MSENLDQQQFNRVIDLKVGAHVIPLEMGLYCVLHAPGQREADGLGLPGIRISRAPLSTEEDIEIITFSSDGWLGAANNAALVKVKHDHAGILVTTYQEPGSPYEGPRLQVMRLFAGAETVGQPAVSSQRVVQPPSEQDSVLREVSAHIQREGDVVRPVGVWMGKPGSGLWIEGFSVSPECHIKAEDIEYQAVLGKGWLSPWSDGGQFCGSRGMSLPILGMCIRLKEQAAKEWKLRLSGCFTDGTKVGPLEGAEIMLESEGLAPLEAFQLDILPLANGQDKLQNDQKKATRRDRAGVK
ncbi:hypothetical protein PT277_00670 [Acetobacteraceae bacterium ESL0709]|nr:hypothetical protein [Acetobacteraceae bacterium ESL0697]MDF7677226.1 hypothetical protein [Acetobacteraceae bacterium ESL0709]